MFEKQVAISFAVVSEILERVLGTYFEGIDTESLHVSVFSGTVVLDNLRMRPTAFSALGLPLAVKHGRVRHVELELSLRNLRGTPARMHIDGIDIVVDPNDTAKGAQPDDLQTLTARKRALQKDRNDRRQALLAPKDGSNSSITSRLVTGFISNLVIHLSDVHIRVETPTGTLGARMQAFALTTTDAQWHPANVEAGATELFKQAQISQLSMYTQAKPPGSAEAEVLAPVDLVCRARLMLTAPSSFDKPLMSVDFKLGTAKTIITDATIRDVTALLDSLASSNQRRKRMAARPLTPGYRGHFPIWWRYAIGQVREEVRVRTHAWKTETVVANARRLRAYVPLFRRSLAILPLPALETHEEAAMSELEDEMSQMMVLAIRTGVQNSLQSHAREALSQAREHVKKQPKASLFSRFFGRRGGSEGSDTNASRDPPGGGIEGESVCVGSGVFKVNLTKEERVELERLLESKAVADSDADVPASWVKFTFSFTFDAAQLQLSRHRSGSALVHAQFSGLCVVAKVRSTGWMVQTSLQSTCVQDKSDRHGGGGGSAERQVFGKDGEDMAPLLFLEYGVNPLDSNCEQSLKVRVERSILFVDVELLGQLQTWWKHAVPGEGQSVTMLRAREYAVRSVQHAQARAHDAIANVLSKSTRESMRIDLHLSAPTILVPFEARAACGEEGGEEAHLRAGAKERVQAVAAASIGIMRVANSEPEQGADVYEASLSGMRMAVCESAKDNWSREAAWRHDPGLVAPFTLAVRATIRQDRSSEPPGQASAHVTAHITAVHLTLSERNCQWAQDLVCLGRGSRKQDTETTVTVQHGSAPGARLRLLKSASLPFDFSDSFKAEAKQDAQSAAPRLRKGLSYTAGQPAQPNPDAGGRRHYLFQLVCPRQMAKLRREKSADSKEMTDEWDRYAKLQRLVLVFKTDSVALQLTRHACKEPLLLFETRALAVNAVVRSLSLDLTFSLADVSIKDLHTRFDDARCNVVAKSGRIHEAADEDEAASAPGCLVLALSLVDRKAPEYTTDVAYRAKLGGFGLVCSAPLVHLCSKWATDAFRLHSTASGDDQHVPSQVSTENAESHCCSYVGDRGCMHRSMSTDVSVGRLDVWFITVEGGRYAHLAMLEAVGLSVEHRESGSGGVSTKIKVAKLRALDTRSSSLSMPSMLYMAAGHEMSGDDGGKDCGCKGIFGAASLDENSQKVEEGVSASANPLVYVLYEMPPATLLGSVPKLKVDVGSSRLLSEPKFFAKCIELYAQLNEAASSAFRKSVTNRLVRSSMSRLVRSSTMSAISSHSPPIFLTVNVSAIVVSAVPPNHPSNVFIFQMNRLHLKGKHDSQHLEVAHFRLSSKRKGDEVWHADFGGKFSRHVYTNVTHSDDLVCSTEYQADFDHLNFKFDPLTVSLVTDIWQDSIDHVSAPLAMLSQHRQQGENAKDSERRPTFSVGSSSPRLRKQEHRSEQLKIAVKIQRVSVGFVLLLQPSQRSELSNGSSDQVSAYICDSSLTRTDDCLSILCTGLDLTQSQTTQHSVRIVTYDVSVEEFAVEFKMAQSNTGIADRTNQEPIAAAGKHMFPRVVSSERLTRLDREMRVTEEKYRRAFRESAGESGEIDAAELVNVLQSLGMNVTERIARKVLVQLDSNADGILNEEEFLQSLYLVTRSQKHKDTAQGSAPESDSLEGDTPATWKSIRIKYSQVAESRAHVQVDVQRIEVNLTIEPLEMILAILDEMNSDSTLQAPPPEKAQTLGAPSHDACAGVLGARSEPLAKNEDDGPVGWMRSISERAFLRPSDTIRARSLDIQVRMGSVDMAVIPRSDSELLCDNALVFQMLSLEFSSKVDKNNLPCEYLCAHGLTVVIAEFPLGPPDGDVQLIPPSRLEYSLSHGLQGGFGVPDVRISFNGSAVEITCTQVIWLLWLVGRFSAVTKRSSSGTGSHSIQRWKKLQRPRDGDEKRVTEGTLGHCATVKLAQEGLCLVKFSDMTLTVKTFSKAPLVQVGLKSFTITSKLQKNVHSLKVECGMTCNIMSELKHVWEAAIEPCTLSCLLISHRDKRKQDLEIACDEAISVSIAPDHIYSLAQTQRQLETALQALATGEYSHQGMKHHENEGSRGSGLSDFFGAFMPAERVLFMNSTNLMIHVQIETEDDLDNWEARVAARSSVMVPKYLLRSYGVKLLAVRQSSNASTYRWSQALFGVTDATSQTQGSMAAPPLIQAAVCDSESSADPAVRLQLRCNDKSILVHCPWVVENLCPVSISVSTFLSQDPTAPASNVVVIPAGESEEQYSVDLSADKPFYLAVCCDGFSPMSRVRIQQGGDCSENVVAMQDSAGRKLEVRIKMYVDLNNNTVISVHPQIVIVNRCRLSLRYGRCKLLDSASQNSINSKAENGYFSSNGLYIEEAASQEMVAGAGLQKPGSAEKENWNKSEPHVMMFSLPEGPEWSPCVCLPDSDSWVRISRSVFGVKEDEDEEDEDEGKTSAASTQHRTSLSKETSFTHGALNLVTHIQLQEVASAVDSADTDGVLRAVELAVEMHVGSGSFHNSVYMEVMPAVTVINNTAHVLEFARVQLEKATAGDGASRVRLLQLAPGEQLSYHGIFSLDTGHVPQSYRYTVSSLGDPEGGGRDSVRASLPFSIAEERIFPLSLWSKSGRKWMLDVRVKKWSAATFVHFSEVQKQQPWYQIRNCSADHYVHITQGLNRSTDIEHALAVAPGQALALSWDNPEAPHLVYAFASASLEDWTNRECGAASLPGDNHRRQVDMDRLGELKHVVVLPDWKKAQANLNKGSAYATGGMRKQADGYKRLSLSTTLLGHTRVLEVYDTTQGRISGHPSSAKEAQTTAAQTQGEPPGTEAEAHVRVHALVKLGGLGVSVVDHSRQELLYATFASVSVTLSTSADVLRVRALVSECQIDNASMHGPRTVFVSPYQRGGAQHFLDADLELLRAVKSVRYWRTVSLSIQPVCLQLHEEVLWRLLQFENACYTHPATASVKPSARSSSPVALNVARGTRHVPGACDTVTGLAMGRALVLRELAFMEDSEGLDSGIHLEAMNLAKVAVKVTLLGLNAIRWRSHEYEVNDGNVRILAELYAQLRPMVEGTLGVPDVEGHNVVLPELEVKNRSVAHGGSIVTILWVHYRRSVMLQGLKVLGSPAFWSSLLGDAGDTQQKRKEKMTRNARKRNLGPVDGVGKGLAQGLQDAGGGLWEGVTGAVIKPWEAATAGGWDGLGHRMLAGLGAGAVGLVAKPATGVISLTSKVAIGVTADLLGGGNDFARKRPPRPAYWDTRLRAYCMLEALVYNSCASTPRLAGDERINRLQHEGFVGAVRVLASRVTLRYDFLVFSRTHVRVLMDVEDAATDDTQEAKELTLLELTGSGAVDTLQVSGSTLKFLDASKRERMAVSVAAEDVRTLSALLDRVALAARAQINITYLS